MSCLPGSMLSRVGEAAWAVPATSPTTAPPPQKRGDARRQPLREHLQASPSASTSTDPDHDRCRCPTLDDQYTPMKRHSDGPQNVRRGERPTGEIRRACPAPAEFRIANGPIDADMAPGRPLPYKVGNPLHGGRTEPSGNPSPVISEGLPRRRTLRAPPGTRVAAQKTVPCDFFERE